MCIDAYALNCLISQRYAFLVFDITIFILNINHVSDEKIFYMCLPSIYMILPVFYGFYYMFLLFVCIHALSEMTK